MTMTRIVVVAPDSRLAKVADSVARGMKEDIDIVEGVLSKGVEKAAQALARGAEVIISRGGTALMIEEELGCPTIPVQVTGYDIIQALHKAKMSQRNRVGVVGFSNVVRGVQRLASIFPFELKTATVNSARELEARVYQLCEHGIEVFIGGSAVGRAAKKYGVESILLESGEEAIEEAIKEAKRVLNIRLREKERSEQFKAVLNFAYDGIIAVDGVGQITVFNPVAGRLIGIDPEHAIGKPIQAVIPNTELLNVIRTGETQLGEFQTLRDKQIVTNRVPIVVDGRVTGAVATFQDATRIQEMEQKIRERLHSKGLVAKFTFEHIAYQSEVMKVLIAKARRFAVVDSTVLLSGESGTGKEMVAQSLHNASKRKKGPFVAVNCAALPENLLESELFGYVEGAFTGARKAGKVGLFELAHGGTIFLDEISEMSLPVQARFLRVIQEREVTRIGDDKVIPVNVRILAATNKDLEELVRTGGFREDLYYRLSVLKLEVPPLRERPDDVPLLVERFIEELNQNLGKKIKGVTPAALRTLQTYHWPGNVRQLHNIIEAMMVLCDDELISQELVREVMGRSTEGYADQREERRLVGDQGLLQQQELTTILRVLHEVGGKRTEAARRLGISVTTLWRKLKSMDDNNLKSHGLLS